MMLPVLRRRHARKALRLARLLAELETANGLRRARTGRSNAASRASLARV
jgi:hypothetical protein